MKRQVVFDGLLFHVDRNNRYYYHDFYNGTGKKGRIKKSLHRYTWEKFNGSIPKGYAVHHKDGDIFNNSINNLEIITHKTHGKYHMMDRFRNPKYRKKNKLLLDNIRPLAEKWHRDPRNHKQNILAGIKSWKNKKKIVIECVICTTKYKTYWFGRNMYCSQQCRNRAFRLRSGKDIRV